MKKTLITLSLMLLAVLTANAQMRQLDYKNLTDENETWDLEKAGVIISCDYKKAITFETNLEGANVNVYKTELDGENKIYYLILNVDNASRQRQLSIKSPNYYTLLLDLKLRNGHLYRYEVYDPNDAIDGTCFQTHREKGMQYYDDCIYMSAKEEFELARQCDEADESQRQLAQKYINDCDSMIEWRRLGNEAFSILDYELAMEYFSKAQALNSQDRYIVDRYAECANAQGERSRKYMEAANRFFKEKEYEDAITMYKKVEDLRESNAGLALTQRLTAQRLFNRKKNPTSLFGLEFGMGDNKLYGFTVGSYRNRTGGYFTLKTNEAAFDMARGEYKLAAMPEVDLSFGWTKPIIKRKEKFLNGIFQGLYVHFTPFGFAVLNHYTPKKSAFGDGADLTAVTQEDVDKKIEEGSKVRDLLSLNVSAAIAPEIGAALKIWPVCLRATCQYRWAFSKKDEDFFGKKVQWSLGIGYCY